MKITYSVEKLTVLVAYILLSVRYIRVTLSLSVFLCECVIMNVSVDVYVSGVSILGFCVLLGSIITNIS